MRYYLKMNIHATNVCCFTISEVSSGKLISASVQLGEFLPNAILKKYIDNKLANANLKFQYLIVSVVCPTHSTKCVTSVWQSLELSDKSAIG